MTDDPSVLRTYAAIFEMPKRDPVSGTMTSPSEACVAAAKALRFQADAVERTNRQRDEAGED